MDDMPAWLPDAFAQAPFAVVRRAKAPPGCVAIGFRGTGRAHRHGAVVECERVESVMSPEHLRHRTIPADRTRLKAFAALAVLVEDARLDPFVWGPTGSVGFELATARPAATDASDLDLLIRAPRRLPATQARSLRDHLHEIEQAMGLRIDVQLETPAGGIALSEWAQDKPRVMARASSGAKFVADPWECADPMLEAAR